MQSAKVVDCPNNQGDFYEPAKQKVGDVVFIKFGDFAFTGSAHDCQPEWSYSVGKRKPKYGRRNQFFSHVVGRLSRSIIIRGVALLLVVWKVYCKVIQSVCPVHIMRRSFYVSRII